MPSIRVIVATLHFVLLLLLSEVFASSQCVTDSLQRFGGVSIADYNQCCEPTDEIIIRELQQYFDAFQDNRTDEALKHLENVKSTNVSSRSLFTSRSVTAIVSVFFSAEEVAKVHFNKLRLLLRFRIQLSE